MEFAEPAPHPTKDCNIARSTGLINVVGYLIGQPFDLLALVLEECDADLASPGIREGDQWHVVRIRGPQRLDDSVGSNQNPRI